MWYPLVYGSKVHKKSIRTKLQKKIITFTDKYHYFVLTPESVRIVGDVPAIQLYIIMTLKHLCPEVHAMAILAKNHQMAGENLNEVPRSAPQKGEGD